MLLKRKPHKFTRKPSQLSSGGFGNDGSGELPSNFDPWQGMFEGMPYDSGIKHLIEPGDDLDKLAMRTVFGLREPPDMLEVAACKSRYDRFHQTRHLDMLKFVMAGATSIGGASRSELMQFGTKILAETALNRILAIRSGTLPELLKHDGKKPKQNMHYPEDEQEE